MELLETLKNTDPKEIFKALISYELDLDNSESNEEKLNKAWNDFLESQEVSLVSPEVLDFYLSQD